MFLGLARSLLMRAFLTHTCHPTTLSWFESNPQIDGRLVFSVFPGLSKPVFRIGLVAFHRSGSDPTATWDRKPVTPAHTRFWPGRMTGPRDNALATTIAFADKD